MKILFLSPHDITKMSSGGTQCAKRNYDLLCDIVGIENIYACIFPEVIPEKLPNNIKAFEHTHGKIGALFAALSGCKIYLKKHESVILEYINALSPDIVFFDGSLLGRIADKLSKSTKKIVFFHNIEYYYALNKVKHEGPQFYPSFWASRSNEKCAIDNADAVICLNRRDSITLKKLYGRNADLLLPISFKDDFNEKHVPEHITKKELLFVGSHFAPNIDGITWFVKNVMPFFPEVVLHIVGKGFEEEKEKLECDNVKVIGTVDVVSEYYYNYSAVVLPIRYGDGMKVKTAEAIMYGKTMFATDEALEGYETDDIQDIHRCNTSEEFIKSIKDYFSSNEYKSVSQQVREYFVRALETENLRDKLEELLNSV